MCAGAHGPYARLVDLPVMPPIKPMLAKAIYEVPRADGLMYEPKWDGFRCLVFRDGDEIELWSRTDRPLNRYFPEMEGALRAELPERCVVDGELVVVTDDGLDFDTLQLRLHPAESRVNMLAAATPASFVAFDLLALGDRDLMSEPPARAAASAGGGARRPPGPGAPHSRDRGSRRGRGLVPALRGRRVRRGHGQARGRAVPAGQARHAQGQAPAHGRLRGGGLPPAQGRRGGRVAAARPLRRRRHPAPRGGGRLVRRAAAARRCSPTSSLSGTTPSTTTRGASGRSPWRTTERPGCRVA